MVAFANNLSLVAQGASRAQRRRRARCRHGPGGRRHGLLDRQGRVSGGTGMAIRLARHHGVPVLNLAETDPREALRRLEGIAVSVGASLSRRSGGEEREVVDRPAERRRTGTARIGHRGRPHAPRRPAKRVQAARDCPCAFSRPGPRASSRGTDRRRGRAMRAKEARMPAQENRILRLPEVMQLIGRAEQGDDPSPLP